jgi:hypothetical protein
MVPSEAQNREYDRAHSTSKCTTLLNDFKRSVEAEALSRPLVKQNLQALYLS